MTCEKNETGLFSPKKKKLTDGFLNNILQCVANATP